MKKIVFLMLALLASTVCLPLQAQEVDVEDANYSPAETQTAMPKVTIKMVQAPVIKMVQAPELQYVALRTVTTTTCDVVAWPNVLMRPEAYSVDMARSNTASLMQNKHKGKPTYWYTISKYKYGKQTSRNPSIQATRV